jgi:hypothetical protein
MIFNIDRKKILSALLAVFVAAAIVCAGSTPSYAAGWDGINVKEVTVNGDAAKASINGKEPMVIEGEDKEGSDDDYKGDVYKFSVKAGKTYVANANAKNGCYLILADGNGGVLKKGAWSESIQYSAKKDAVIYAVVSSSTKTNYSLTVRTFAPSKAKVTFIVHYPACPSVIFKLKGEYATYGGAVWGGPYYIDGKKVSKKTMDNLWLNEDIYSEKYQKEHTIGHSITFKNVVEGTYAISADGRTIKTIKKNVKVNTSKAKTIDLKTIKMKKW